jgi:ubiquinone/menaquinone biosynthesis C-methylase UbiE
MVAATRRHYDAHHFIEGGGPRVKWWRTFLATFLPNEEVRGALIADVGSSVGEISRGLIDRGARLVCLDVSLESLRRCKANNPEAVIVHGNALQLPFADQSFDHTISIGVLHHTPDCRLGFHEVARVTGAGGSMVIFLYNKWSFYNVVYNGFAPVRKRVPLTSVPEWMVQLMNPLVKLHLGQSLNGTELRNLVGDALWTPRATFHSVREVRRWSAEEGLLFQGYRRFFLGYANVFHFRKPGQRTPEMRREPQFMCLHCKFAPMHHEADAVRCPACGRAYEIQGGIVRVME